MILGAARGSFLALVVPAGRLEIVTHCAKKSKKFSPRMTKHGHELATCETQVARARAHEVTGVSCEAKQEQK